MLEKCGAPPITALEGVGELLEMAGKGECLNAAQLEKIGGTLTAVKRLKDYLNRGMAYPISLPYYEENLDPLEEIREELNQKIRGGRVDDYASPLLRSLREGIHRTEAKMREKAEGVIRANKECMSDHFSTARNGRICVPVKKECRARISGSVIDKSATGNTLFMEPLAVSKLFEELQEMRIDAENEERRILYTLTAMLSDKEEAIARNNRTIEKLDFIFAKGKLSQAYEGTEPKINTRRRIRLVKGRHPLMDQRVNVPLDFALGEGINGVVITGPNTGGKTVAVKTVALNCLMAQCGLHVAGEMAEICMNNLILCDIGDGQDITENLSTFSAHIRNVLEVLNEVNKDSFVIMDELGSGTDPAEGMGIAVAILEELKKSGAIFLVTTHYPEIKEYADKTEGVVNARMTFDRETLKPAYQMVIGEAGESCAFYIADRLGMPNEMLRTAVRAAYGEDALASYPFGEEDTIVKKRNTKKISRIKKSKGNAGLTAKYNRGDSVMVYPDRKIGIVCEPVNEKGVLRVQMPGKKIWINHKRVKLHVVAEELYPEDYDFSIVFDTVANRKIRHDMERKYTDEVIMYQE